MYPDSLHQTLWHTSQLRDRRT